MSMALCSHIVTPLGGIARKLLTGFCSCPFAVNLLLTKKDELVKNLFLRVQKNISYSRVAFAFDLDSQRFQNATILIPKRIVDIPEGITRFTFLIFNCMRKPFEQLEAEAESGNIGMDPYAYKQEELTFQNTQNYDDLVKKCARYWRIENSTLPNYLIYQSKIEKEIQLFRWEVHCHTDVPRADWVTHYQKSYCWKHPDDQRSCETEIEDLCSFDAFNRLPAMEQDKIVAHRVCHRYPKASQKIRKAFQSIVKANCPSQLNEISMHDKEEF